MFVSIVAEFSLFGGPLADSIIFILKLQKLASNESCPNRNPLRLTKCTVSNNHYFSELFASETEIKAVKVHNKHEEDSTAQEGVTGLIDFNETIGWIKASGVDPTH